MSVWNNIHYKKFKKETNNTENKSVLTYINVHTNAGQPFCMKEMQFSEETILFLQSKPC